jgi:phage terminase small subunit
MAELKNIRWERFCHGLLEGKPAVQAYEDAGYKRNDGNAGRLTRNEQIIARLAELKAEAARVAVMDRAWVLRGLRELFEMSMGLRCVGNRPDGDYAWSPATAKGVLELVGKELGLFIDRKIIGIKRLEDMGDDELRQIAGQVIEELDAQVTVDGEVKPVEAELLPPAARQPQDLGVVT